VLMVVNTAISDRASESVRSTYTSEPPCTVLRYPHMHDAAQRSPDGKRIHPSVNATQWISMPANAVQKLFTSMCSLLSPRRRTNVRQNIRDQPTPFYARPSRGLLTGLHRLFI
jgi:hypothetical protein